MADAVSGTSIVKRYKDSGAGFLIEIDEDNDINATKTVFIKDPDTLERCESCQKEILHSFLRQKFDILVCDDCRSQDSKYDFITRTDAKNEFLLKDCDFDKRPPPLKFLMRKNPHHEHGSHMRLYLRYQVEQRAIEVWGNQEGLEEAREQKKESSYKRKKNAVAKRFKEARKQNVAAALVKTKMATHTHSFGPEVAAEEDDDLFERVCIECGFRETYEKM